MGVYCVVLIPALRYRLGATTYRGRGDELGCDCEVPGVPGRIVEI
jgi:hypothetical protein